MIVRLGTAKAIYLKAEMVILRLDTELTPNLITLQLKIPKTIITLTVQIHSIGTDNLVVLLSI